MAMDQSAFERLATALLEDFFDAIDASLGDELDVDYEGGILTIKLSDGRTFLLNKHAPNREIWLSSPVSGAWHFAYVEGEEIWRSTRPVSSGPDTLAARLEAELNELTGGGLDLGK
jgi:frataxin